MGRQYKTIEERHIYHHVKIEVVDLVLAGAIVLGLSVIINVLLEVIL